MRTRTRAAALAVAATCLLGGAAAPAAADQNAIVGGSPAPAGKYPYAAYLDGTIYSCGGSLIAPEWILTAGHCIALYSPTVGPAVPAAHITAVVGRNDLRDDSTGTERIGAAAFMHPLYAGGLVPRFDVALIRLAQPITGYSTVKIAGPGEEPTWKAGTDATIIGWGLTKEDGDPSDVLREAQVPIVSDPDCTQAYRIVGPVSDYDATSMLCAGYLGRGGVDTCQGDSGGPLLVPTSQGYRQAGITSWGYGCADPDYPGVYSRIGAAALRDFVALHVPQAIGQGATPAGGSTKPGGGKKPKRTARSKSRAHRRAVRRKLARRAARERAARRAAAPRAGARR